MPITKPRSRLKIAGVEAPISSFELQAPANALGIALQVQLADVSQVIDVADEIEFALLEDTGAGWQTIISSGNVAGRRVRVQLRGDALQLNSVSLLDDRFALCPRAATVIFDPLTWGGEVTTKTTRADLQDEDGIAIATVFVSTDDLDLLQLLDYVYVDQLGFASVVTNIETFVIRRVNFSPGSTWHEATAPVLQFFEAYYCASPDGTVLYVLDPRAAMPVEITATAFGLGEYIALQKDLPAGRIINAVMLSFKPDVGTDGDLSGLSDREETEDIEVGTEFTVGYTKTHIIRHFKDILDGDGNLMRSVNWQTETDSYSADPITTLTIFQGHESQIDTYTADWRLKVGHVRTVNARTQLPLGGTSPVMTEIGTETQHNLWIPSTSKPSDFILALSTTELEGLILTEGDPDDPNQKVTRVALMDANHAQQVTTDGFQDTSRGPIRTTIEYWRETGSGQVDVHRQVIDHLTGGMDPSSGTSSLSAGAALNSSGDTTSTRLFRDLTSEGIWGPRKPLQLNAGDVPYAIAEPIALARLAAGGQPLRPASIELPGYVASIVRGSLLTVADRDGDEDVLVTSYTIRGDAQGFIRMAVEGIVIEA